MAKHAKPGEPWSPVDVKQLIELVRDNTPTRVIALKLGRSEASVQSKPAREHLSLKPVNQRPRRPRR
jgi:hypothetical protein